MDEILTSFEAENQNQPPPAPSQDGTKLGDAAGPRAPAGRPNGRRAGAMSRQGRGGVKTDGVRVCCAGVEEEGKGSDVGAGGDDVEVGGDADADAANEEDELMWWCWDGKLEGLSDL